MNFKWIGHYNDLSENHDKVWGAIYLDNDAEYPRRVLTFWGRRGKKISTKLATDNWELKKLVQSKLRKGYNDIDRDKLDNVYPEFEADLEKTTMWALLKL